MVGKDEKALSAKAQTKFIVEKLTGKRKRTGRVEFLVKWKGCAASESTWEPCVRVNPRVSRCKFSGAKIGVSFQKIGVSCCKLQPCHPPTSLKSASLPRPPVRTEPRSGTPTQGHGNIGPWEESRS